MRAESGVGLASSNVVLGHIVNAECVGNRSDSIE